MCQLYHRLFACDQSKALRFCYNIELIPIKTPLECAFCRLFSLLIRLDFSSIFGIFRTKTLGNSLNLKSLYMLKLPIFN